MNTIKKREWIVDINDVEGIKRAVSEGAQRVFVRNGGRHGNLEGLLLTNKLGPRFIENLTPADVREIVVY